MATKQNNFQQVNFQAKVKLESFMIHSVSPFLKSDISVNGSSNCQIQFKLPDFTCFFKDVLNRIIQQ